MSLYYDEEEVVEYLRDKGYRVQKIDCSGMDSMTCVKDLVNHFYARRLFYNPDRKFPESRNFREDTKYLSGFVKKRQQLGLGRKDALQEAAVLIDALFKFEEHLKLKEPVISPRILEVDSIMNRICSFANGEVAEVSEAETAMFVDEINEVYNKEFAANDSEIAAQMRQRILRRLYDQRCSNV